MEYYKVGDEVPYVRVGAFFDIINDYGKNYNTFPFRTDDYILLIRNGIYKKSCIL